MTRPPSRQPRDAEALKMPQPKHQPTKQQPLAPRRGSDPEGEPSPGDPLAQKGLVMTP